MRIWFNHWFSTIYHVFNLMREYNKDVYILASNVRENLLIKSGADDWFLEDQLEENEDYVDYCLNICSTHNIDVFIPRKGRNIISKYLDKFENIGVKVLVNRNYEVNNLLNDKISVYERLKQCSDLKELVPYYLVVNNVDDFKNACVLTRYYIEKTDCDKICIKNSIDEGGITFKVLLDDKKISDTKVLGYNEISEKEMEKIIGNDKGLKRRIIMPYLHNEVSCDVLRTSNGTIVLTRYRYQNHVSEVKLDRTLENYCTKLADEFDIFGPCNIQFRKINDKWKLLDINNRMSGGIQISSLGSSMNLPLIALNQLVGMNDANWNYSEKYKTEGVYVGNIEIPILLK